MKQKHLIILGTCPEGIKMAPLVRAFEEAPSLGKPVLVMRETTERPDAAEAGTVILVGTCKQSIIDETLSLLDDTDRYAQMSRLHNPYGDGHACQRNVEFLESLKS